MYNAKIAYFGPNFLQHITLYITWIYIFYII